MLISSLSALPVLHPLVGNFFNIKFVSLGQRIPGELNHYVPKCSLLFLRPGNADLQRSQCTNTYQEIRASQTGLAITPLLQTQTYVS